MSRAYDTYLREMKEGHSYLYDSRDIRSYIIPTPEPQDIINKRAEIDHIRQQIEDFNPPIKNMSELMAAQHKMAVISAYERFGVLDHAPKWERDLSLLVDRMNNLKNAIKAQSRVTYNIEALRSNLICGGMIPEGKHVSLEQDENGRLVLCVTDDSEPFPIFSFMFKEDADQFRSDEKHVKGKFIEVRSKDIFHVMDYLYLKFSPAIELGEDK